MSEVMQRLRLWWQSLAAREQVTLLVGAGLAAPLLVYLLLWQPVRQAELQAAQAADALRQDLAEAQRLAAQLRAQPTASRAAGQRMPPLPAIEQAARQFALSEALKRREAESNNAVRVTLEAAPAEALMRMLQHLQEQGLHVVAAQIDPISPGRVNAQITLQSHAP